MKFLLILMAVTLLSTINPNHFANGITRPAADPTVTYAKDGTATTQARGKQITRRRKKTVKPRCPPVVVAKADGAATTTATGLTYIITRHTQDRQPLAGETVAVNYTGLLTSGVKFDSSLDRGQPISFPLGMGRVIKGWDEGIAKLRVGEQATLIIPPHLGYAERGAGGVIPPNATLVFLVELVSIKEATKTN